ncbi:hypothetical protein F5880DRAFT_1706161 [Lentinula raphanica]|nr:hypothetical protein F5880DRAFT_1706161 [Lentinula raphanica]
MSLWPGMSHVGCPYGLEGPMWDVPMAWKVPCGMSLWPGRSHVGCPYDLECPRWDVPMACRAVPGEMLLWPGMSLWLGMSYMGYPYGLGCLVPHVWDIPSPGMSL